MKICNKNNSCNSAKILPSLFWYKCYVHKKRRHDGIISETVCKTNCFLSKFSLVDANIHNFKAAFLLQALCNSYAVKLKCEKKIDK